MNPYRVSYPNSHPSGVAASCSQPPPLESASDPSYDPSPPVIQTDRSSVIISHRASSDHAGCQDSVPSPSTAPQLPDSNPEFSVGSSPQSALALVSSPEPAFTENPYPLPGSSYQVSVIVPSSDLHPFPLPAERSEENCPDLECAICFSQFNNVFRCPKMLQCKHTFCLECLARINVKSTEPSAIQCPLCRSFTPLPTLGLPKLATDSNVLSYLPAAMQRVYSIRFLRSKGKLQVKRSTEGQRRWPRQSLTSLRSINHSLDVGVPNSAPEGLGESGRASGSLFRLTGQPVCRAFLLISVVLMMMLLTGIIVFLLTFKRSQ
ncbi:RING finger protein 208 [Archocentrus centrarchus]|uniref:RING finger protein 208 n=1 Tax=Archocentrus centrarchus TaxID=63155 RepID=UPI0011E9F7AD|nr:RING finger protein 208-like [Archocentrus centrarchus]